MAPSQFGQRGEQGPVGGVLLEVVIHRLHNHLVVVKVSRPLADQGGKTLREHDRKWDKTVVFPPFCFF